jgi:hypothetical protein
MPGDIPHAGHHSRFEPCWVCRGRVEGEGDSAGSEGGGTPPGAGTPADWLAGSAAAAAADDRSGWLIPYYCWDLLKQDPTSNAIETK